MEKKPAALSVVFYLGFILLCAIMAASFFYTIHIPDKQAERGQSVGHTREVIGQLNLLEDNIYKAAFAEKINSQSAYSTAQKQAYANLSSLQKLTADNPSQQKNITQLRNLIPSAFGNPEILLKQFNKMRFEEERLLVERTHIWQLALQHTKITIFGIQLLLFTAILISYHFLSRELIKRKQTITEGLIEEDRLHAIVALQNKVMTSDLDINNMMKLIVDCACKLVKADASVIERVENSEMVYDAVSGTATPFAGLRISIRNSFSGKAVRERLVLKCDDAQTDPHADREACKRVGLRSMITVPLLRNNEVFGVLKVYSAKRAAFSNKDVDTMEIIATLLSARITDALSFSAINEINNELESQKEALLYSNAELGELATTDGLTGLRNQRYFMEKLHEEFNRAKRYNSKFSIILFDVDYFKKFNDSFGHIAGDNVLRKIGTILQNISRDTDIIARYGGEEFSLILPTTDANGALFIAERLRTGIAEAQWEHRDITVSVGVSTYSSDYTNAKALLERADEGLYAAKDAGRNCVRQL